jgi:hypothetical protein
MSRGNYIRRKLFRAGMGLWTIGGVVLAVGITLTSSGMTNTKTDRHIAGARSLWTPHEIQANSFTGNRQTEAALAADADGQLLCVWMSRKQDGSTPGIYAQRLNAAGDGVGAEFQVDPKTQNAQVLPDIAACKDGSFWIVWQSGGQDGDQAGIVGRRYGLTQTPEGPAFGPLCGETLINTQRAGNQIAPAVASNDAGQVLVTWMSATQSAGQAIVGRLFDHAGAPLTEDFALASAGNHRDRNVTAAGLSGGRFVAAWDRVDADGTPVAVLARTFDGAGNALSDEFRLSSTSMGQPIEPAIAAAADGSLVVGWMERHAHESAYRVMARRFAADGTPLTDELLVAGGVTEDWHSGVAVAVGPDGRFAVAYNVEGDRDPLAPGRRPVVPADVFARIFTPEGDPIGAVQRINQHSAGSQRLAAGVPAQRMVWTQHDQLAVAWQGSTAEGDKKGVGLTVFAPEGLASRLPEPTARFAEAATPATNQSATSGIAMPVFDPDFVPEPRETSVLAMADEGFIGFTATGWYPPDPDLAVGPYQVVAVVNASIAIFDKETGEHLYEKVLNGGGGFWGSVGATNYVFDPVAVYDVLSDRFIVAAAERVEGGGEALCLAVSKSDDTADGWYRYRYLTTHLGTDIDFPNLGVDADNVYLAADYFAEPIGNWLHIVPKAPLLVGQPSPLVPVRTSTQVSIVGTVKTFDADAPAQYFVTPFKGSGRLMFYAVRYTGMGEPEVDSYSLSVPQFGQPPNAEQKGTSNKADTVDFRIKNGVLRNDHLYLSHAIRQDGVARVRWYDIVMNGWPLNGDAEPQLRTYGDINLGPGVHTWSSDTTASADGVLAIAFNRSSLDEYIGVARGYRLSGDWPGTMREIVTQQVSTSPENGDRWGDYSGICEDPTNPRVFWNMQEYRTSSWRTWIGRFEVPYPTMDADMDGDVDLADHAAFQNCFYAGGNDEECMMLDYDGSGRVNLDDHAQQLELWTGPDPE